MKRSTINSLIIGAIDFMNKQMFSLPGFAYWNLNEWLQKNQNYEAIVEAKLGWDVTDLGDGNFEKLGLILFTLRNKTHYPDGRILRSYAEKVMVIRKMQAIPLHFHRIKVEDIINRGGGNLIIEFHNSSDDGQLENGVQDILVDGIWRKIQSGDTVILCPGESVTIPQLCFHRFWAEKGDVLIGEVSTSNDDDTDNYFLREYSRFPTISEDEQPKFLLVNDYPSLLLGRNIDNRFD